MAVCQFFLRGNCRFGDECRNEHPGKPTFGNNSWNRATTSATNNADPASTLPFKSLHIRNDLTVDKPNWPLSSYAPAKFEPQLIAGLDESPEELRVKAFEAVKTGKLNEYIAYEANQIAAADAVYRNGHANSEQLYEQALKQSHFPALDKQLKEEGSSKSTSAFGTTSNTGSAFASTSSAFGNTTTTPSPFGNSTSTSVFGKPATTSVFGQPAFGQTSTPGAGTTSVFGQPSTSAFGQPASAFGQPSTTTATSAFGQPSAFGQHAQDSSSSVIKPASGAFSGSAPSAFGSTAGGSSGGGGGAFSAFAGKTSAFAALAQSNPSGGSVFGQPSFGQPVPAAKTSVFGQPAPPTTASVFGQPATTSTSVFGQPTPATTSAFGQPAPATTSVFGQPAQTTTTTSVFGQPAPAASTSVFGQPAASTSVFGTPATGTTSVFGTPATQNNSGSVFGAPSTFGQPQTQTPSAFASDSSAFNTSGASTAPTPVFGGTNTNAAPTSVFGHTNTTTAPTSVFGNPSAASTSVFGQSAFSNAPQTTSVFGAPSAFGAQTNTSVFGAQPTQRISAFAPTAPSISAEMKSAISTSAGVSDFASLMGRYSRITTPYDEPLKDGYAALLSKGTLEAFQNEKFEFGKVPEFLPPLEAR